MQTGLYCDITKWSEYREKREEAQSLSPGCLQGLEFWEVRGNKQRRLKKESQGRGEKLGQCVSGSQVEKMFPRRGSDFICQMLLMSPERGLRINHWSQHCGSPTSDLMG